VLYRVRIEEHRRRTKEHQRNKSEVTGYTRHIMLFPSYTSLFPPRQIFRFQPLARSFTLRMFEVRYAHQ